MSKLSPSDQGTVDYAAWRELMVQNQLESRGILDPEVLEAMRRVPREQFVPVEERDAAYEDRPLPIGFGQTISQPFTVAYTIEALQLRGVDWIDASSGGIAPAQKITLGPGYQVPFAQQIRHATGVTTIAVGLIPEPAHAQAIVADGQADLVAIARGIIYDPRWPWHAAATLGATVTAPPQYWRSPPREHADLFGKTVLGMR